LNVYIAAPWIRKADAIAAGEMFAKAGYVVTSRWFNHEGDPNDSTGIRCPDDVIRHQAREDIQDVLRADALVVLNLEKSEGKAVETGIALQAGIPFIVVGERSNIFQILSLGMVESVEDAISLLNTISIPAVA